MPPSKTVIPEDEVRQRVDGIMQGALLYRNFGCLLSTLMEANNHMADTVLIGKIANAGGKRYSAQLVGKYRSGMIEPSYDFVSDLIRSNALNLDPQRIAAPHGEQRVALFTKAELKEVTPDSIRSFNHQVLTVVAVRRSMPLRWAAVMLKLLEFHMQGSRNSVDGIWNEVKSNLAGGGQQNQLPRIRSLLYQDATSQYEERMALYHYVQLDLLQIQQMEEMYEKEHTLYTQTAPKSGSFNEYFNNIMQKLEARNILPEHLVDLSRDMPSSPRPTSQKPRITKKEIVEWKKNTIPSINRMRALTDILSKFTKEEYGCALAQEDIDILIDRSPYKQEQLSDSIYDVIQKSKEHPVPLYVLLKNMRNAAFIGLMPSELARLPVFGRVPVTIKEQQLKEWEFRDGNFPSREQLNEILERFSDFLKRNGRAPLMLMHKAIVYHIADASMAHWAALSEGEKALIRKPKSWRQMVTPYLEDEASPQR